jgi:capsular exopolysaccharide synthesis family protein
MSAQQKPSGVFKQTAAAALSLTSPLLADSLAQGMDLRELILLLRRRASLIVGLTLCGVMASLLIAFTATPRYRSEAVLMLDQRRAAATADMGGVVASQGEGSTLLRSEIDILTSRAVIDRVIKKLDLTKDPEFNPQPFWARWFAPKEDSKNQAEDLAAAHEQTRTADAFLNNLEATNDGRSYSIRVAFESTNPEKAALIANAVADEYLVDQLEAKYDLAARANKWLNERLSSLRQDVESSEKAVENFRQKAGLIEVGGSTVATRQMDEINRQLTEARGQTSQAEARLRSAQNMIRSQGGLEAAADVLNSPLIQRLQEQEAEVRRNEAELATRYGDRHPKMINARAQEHDLQHKIAEEVQKIIQGMANEVEIARAKESQLKRDMADLEARAGVDLKNGVQLHQLEREAEANKTLYESFLGRFKQSTEQQDMQLADSRIIARAEPPLKADFPRKGLFLLVGTLLGLFFGLLAAYLVEYFDRGYKSATQLEEETGLTAVGLIPSLKGVTGKTPEAYVIEKPLSAYSESLRTVRTAIHFSNVDHPPKIVMLTSAIPKEGKTTFCLSLGRALALAGNKILIIDADMRRPRVASALGLMKIKGGLADVLSGRKILADVIERDPKVRNLSLLPAQDKTPNAQDLLGSQRMQKLVQEAAENYDLVIVDTPPILAVTDAAMIARVVDTTLMVVRWGETPRESVVQAVKRLASYGCKIAGIVMAQVDLDQQAQYGDGSYHKDYASYYTD